MQILGVALFIFLLLWTLIGAVMTKSLEDELKWGLFSVPLKKRLVLIFALGPFAWIIGAFVLMFDAGEIFGEFLVTVTEKYVKKIAVWAEKEKQKKVNK